MKTKRQIPTHSFFIEDAEKYGITCAVLLMHIRYWMDENRIHNINYHNGRYWTFSSVKNLQDKFPYLSEKQISTHLLKLENQGVLISDNFNKSSYDRTKWYSLIEEVENEEVEKTDVTILPNGKMEDSKTVQSILPNGKMENTNEENGAAENVKPIPLIKEINKEIKLERGQKEKFCPPSLNEVVLFFQKENIKASPENFWNHWESVGWKKSKGQQIYNWKSLVPKWAENEIQKKPIPAVVNAMPKKITLERKQIFENFKKITRSFVEKLQTDASCLETARIKFNKECNYPKEFNSKVVYNEINNYQIWLMVEPHLISDDDLKNITINQFKKNFFEWFKKQKHSSDMFSETENQQYSQTMFNQK